MKKQLFTYNWRFKKQGEPEFVPVLLPHDAMIHEKRDPEAPGGGAHGYFPDGVYLYEKRLMVPAEWKTKTAVLEFEGIYRHSKVSVNGTVVGGRAYGYVPFTVCLDSCLNYGQENHYGGGGQFHAAKQPLVFRQRNLPSGASAFGRKDPYCISGSAD